MCGTSAVLRLRRGWLDCGAASPQLAIAVTRTLTVRMLTPLLRVDKARAPFTGKRLSPFRNDCVSPRFPEDHRNYRTGKA